MSADPLAASVVIATRERPQMLIETVRSVLAADRVPREIIVVDQSSEPHAELAAMNRVGDCHVRYVDSASQGLSRGRNEGLRLATQPVVVILDDDMIVQRDALERLLEGRGDGARTVSSGRLLMAPPERPGLSQAPGALVTRDVPEVFRGRQPRQVVPGPNIAVPRDVLNEIGGYDERLGAGTRFPAGEDHDLSLRLLEAGCEVRHVPAAVVLHRAWRSRRELAHLRWRYGRGVGGFYAKHASLRDPYVLGRAAREVRDRVRAVLTEGVSAPKAAIGQLLSIGGLFAGALEWMVRYRLRPRSAPRSR